MPLQFDDSGVHLDHAEISRFKNRLLRTKTIISQSSQDGDDGGGGEGGRTQTPGELERVLSTFDLISLGVGSCVGTGMYVVAGLVAKNVAGPGVILSFMIAALASILSGVCYAEFGVRVPKTSGSAYMYSYVTVGEFVAFLIGWNLILEYVIGSAAGASALSACFDALGNHSMSAYLEEHVGKIIGDTYPDFLGCAICLAMTVVMSLGVRNSLLFNNILNGVNFLVWVFIFIAGMVFVDGENWTVNGFTPYGASGVFSGAATCFYAFIGFDIIATTGAEARNARRSIPLAIMSSLVICLLAYVTVSMVVTLMIPYYEIHGDSALMDMFVQRGFGSAKYVVAVGAIAALTVSLFGSMFPMPRVIYAMSRDGLLFSFLSNVNERTGTPLVATVVTGILAAIMALLVGLQVLVEMMSIGTLLAYTLVSTSVLILRYQPSKYDVELPPAHQLDVIAESPEVEAMVDQDDVFSDPKMEKRKYKDDRGLLDDSAGSAPKWYGALPFSSATIESKLALVKRYVKICWLRMGFPSDDCMPTDKSARTTIIFVGLMLLTQIALCLVLVFAELPLLSGEVWAVILLLVFVLAVCACEVIILRQPQNKKKLDFMAPCVPILPSFATLFNFYLMLKLPGLTWIRLGIWIAVGLLLYFSYSMWNSKKEKHDSTSQPPQTDVTVLDDDLTKAGYYQPKDKIDSNGAVLANGKVPHIDGVTANGNVGHSDGVTANGKAHHNSMTSPPGAPPSRPPPPRQESIEKYRQRSMDSDSGSQRSNDSRSNRTGSQQADPHHRNSQGPNSPHPHSRTSHPHQRMGYTADRETPSGGAAQPSDRAQSHDRTKSHDYKRRSLADEGDPFARDEVAKQRQHTAKVTYDSSTARPRPRPQGRPQASTEGLQHRLRNSSDGTTKPDEVTNEPYRQYSNKPDPFSNLEDKW